MLAEVRAERNRAPAFARLLGSARFLCSLSIDHGISYDTSYRGSRATTNRQDYPCCCSDKSQVPLVASNSSCSWLSRDAIVT